jgi:aspartyl-tRNA(Asn)/glutamyl-tRNA(Gln) amidotransferase subunit C
LTIDNKLLGYLEDLSCLALPDGEKSRLGADLQEILSYMAKLAEIDTTGVAARSHPFDNVNAFREDEALPSYERGRILANAPAKSGEAFIAPKTVE